jgi:hypothetical protein
LGAFSTTVRSTLEPYKAFFNGIDDRKPDVINSSWGGVDPAGNATETIAIDGLARQNPTVAFVVSAGNDGAEAAGGPGSGYNNITVGSLGGPDFRDPSDFSSRGPADFHNPETGETVTGVRAAVDIAAPGEAVVAAAYLGDNGSLGASSDPDIQALVEETPSTVGTVGIGDENSYLFESAFLGETELTVSLNWFVGREFDNDADLSSDSDFASDLSFANLNLEIWYYADGAAPLLVAQSISLYNNTEFLRISLETPGLYGITVVFDGLIYDLTSGVTSETYGLAWKAVAVPEPSTALFALLGSGSLLIIARRKRRL